MSPVSLKVNLIALIVCICIGSICIHLRILSHPIIQLCLILLFCSETISVEWVRNTISRRWLNPRRCNLREMSIPVAAAQHSNTDCPTLAITAELMHNKAFWD